ncbi:MAG: hypothetical protein IJ187_02825 [Neisseriaceae bacterium]|nr:hypothetical protein [Neisseriaceae bacterium]MBQ9725096.1 hypothetical protein [Neisseriaceae bacterium]
MKQTFSGSLKSRLRFCPAGKWWVGNPPYNRNNNRRRVGFLAHQQRQHPRRHCEICRKASRGNLLI